MCYIILLALLCGNPNLNKAFNVGSLFCETKVEGLGSEIGKVEILIERYITEVNAMRTES